MAGTLRRLGPRLVLVVPLLEREHDRHQHEGVEPERDELDVRKKLRAACVTMRFGGPVGQIHVWPPSGSKAKRRHWR
eukprot:3693929-Pleurochrysis_carterae.AAC.1